MAKNIDGDEVHNDVKDLGLPGIGNAKDWDAMIPVPYHCLVRMMGSITAFVPILKGTALHRDLIICEEAVNDELKRTKNLQ